MASLANILIVLLTLTISSIAQERANEQFDPNNRCFVPPPAEKDVLIDPTVFSRNEVYTIGEPKTFSWITNAESIRVMMWQQGLSANGLELASAVNSTASLGQTWVGNTTWNGTGPFDFNQGRIFFLSLYDLSNDTIPKFRSHYFNLTDAPPIKNETCTGDSCGSSNKAVVIGAGVGGGVGGALLLAIIAFFVWRFLKKRKSPVQHNLDEEILPSTDMYSEKIAVESSVVPTPTTNTPAELANYSERAELPAYSRHH